jgi:dTDP-4-dehydrorhamnose reductase
MTSPAADAAREIRELHQDRLHRTILLVGAHGQVGWELARSLQGLGHLVTTDRPGRQTASAHCLPLDLTSSQAIRDVVRSVRPELIVNAAAYTRVDQAEVESDAATAVNGVAPGVLAEEARRLDSALVHFSTDQVYDGDGTRPFGEDDPTGPLNTYGRTKLAGDDAIRASSAAHLILRTSWVFGTHGSNFVKTILRLAAERELLEVVADQVGAPTSARVIADVTAQILVQAKAGYAGFLAQQGGVVHLTCAGFVSRHELAEEVVRLARRHGCPLMVEDLRPILTSTYPAPARRPLNARLDCSRLAQRFGLTPPDWRIALRQCLEDLLSRSEA